MFFPNAALCLVNPLCTAGSFKGLCLKLELQQCLTPPPQPALPPCPRGPLWDGAVTHTVFSSKSPPCTVMKSQVFSCCPSPQRLAWERKWSLYYVYVSDLSMPFQKYLHFWSCCLIDFYIYVFSNVRCCSPPGPLLGGKKHCRTPPRMKETSILRWMEEYFKSLCDHNVPQLWKKKKSGREGETNLLCQHHTTGSKFCSVIKKAYTYF